MPVYLFFGEEEYLLDKELKSLKKDVLGSNVSELNYMKHDNPNGKTIQEILLSNPMLFGPTMHIIKFNKTLLGAKKGAVSDEELEKVIEKMSLVNPNVHVVFTCQLEHNPEKKPDKRKKIYKAFTKLGTVKEFAPQFKTYENAKFIPIIQKIGKEKGITLTDEAIICLVETVGVYLIDIDSQLEKLKLYAHPNTKITKDMIAEISVVNEDVFKTVDLILENKTEETLAKILNMLDKTHYLQILAILQTNFLKLLQTKLYSSKYPTSEIARMLGQTDGVVYINQKKIQNVPLNELIRIKQNLSIIEFKLKTGEYKEPMLAFERMLLGGKLC